MPSPFSPKRRLEETIAQLSGIGGGRPLGYGPQRVLSLPDGIARVLAEHVGEPRAEGAPAPTVPTGKATKAIAGDICPECGQATFVYEEGCKKCYGCGFNEC
jgi:ribonucleoside-diphosphate reductase alpha chain